MFDVSDIDTVPVYLCIIKNKEMLMEYWEFYGNGGDTDEN